ncbi:MAG: hypothetical protein CMB42_01080 [Euryarchaeota archaeon]|nr:hypothetical protein [Euryarchaeota archaeon]|tara:strand:+ start:265 stop:534 length:270 start_codon:yes stop_codon:yes gene_type:complete
MPDPDVGVDVFLQADAEPKSSWLLSVMAFIIALLALTIHSIVFPGQNLPVVSDLETFSSLKGQIWIFILGMLVGAAMILSTLLTEVTRE